MFKILFPVVLPFYQLLLVELCCVKST